MASERAEMSAVTPAKCAEKCYNANYSYAATSFGSYCACGEYFATNGQYDSSKCQTTCTGDSSLKCGGDSANSIYALAPG